MAVAVVLRSNARDPGKSWVREVEGLQLDSSGLRQLRFPSTATYGFAATWRIVMRSPE